MRKIRRGRPRKDRLARERASFTLSPQAKDRLNAMSIYEGRSRSDVLNELLLKEPEANYGESRAEAHSELADIAVKLLKDKIAKLCRKNSIKELALFGSVLAEKFPSGNLPKKKFTSESDIDLLFEFQDDARMTLLDTARIEDEFTRLLGRKVDLISQAAIKNSLNPYKRDEILNSAVTIYRDLNGSR